MLLAAALVFCGESVAWQLLCFLWWICDGGSRFGFCGFVMCFVKNEICLVF